MTRFFEWYLVFSIVIGFVSSTSRSAFLGAFAVGVFIFGALSYYGDSSIELGGLHFAFIFGMFSMCACVLKRKLCEYKKRK